MLSHHQIVTTLGQEQSFRAGLRDNNGIFLFGGEDSQGKMDHRLKILRVGSGADLEKKEVKKFENLETFGQGPCARKNHTMNLIPNKSCLIIIGGEDESTNILADIWAISLLHLKWCRITTEPVLEGISKHASASNDTTIFVMGGYHVNKQSFSLWKIDFKIERKAEKKNK